MKRGQIKLLAVLIVAALVVGAFFLTNQTGQKENTDQDSEETPQGEPLGDTIWYEYQENGEPITSCPNTCSQLLECTTFSSTDDTFTCNSIVFNNKDYLAIGVIPLDTGDGIPLVCDCR